MLWIFIWEDQIRSPNLSSTYLRTLMPHPAPTWKREPTIAGYDFEKKAQSHSRTERRRWNRMGKRVDEPRSLNTVPTQKKRSELSTIAGYVARVGRSTERLSIPTKCTVPDALRRQRKDVQGQLLGLSFNPEPSYSIVRYQLSSTESLARRFIESEGSPTVSERCGAV